LQVFFADAPDTTSPQAQTFHLAAAQQGLIYAVAAMVEGVPVALRPRVEFALGKAVEAIPRVDALAGGCVYEMKWDGLFSGPCQPAAATTPVSDR
jgi:hypothetical protein